MRGGVDRRTIMTPEQVDLVQESFARVVPIADQAATLFYDRLFEIAPEVIPLFHGELSEQRRKLMATLATVVAGLGNLPSVLPAASALAKRHVSYGVEPRHYIAVGEALKWTLQRGLGAGWTENVEGAWTAAYTMLSDFMIGEAYGSAVAAE
jgi:nitric oxide dioxygenase